MKRGGFYEKNCGAGEAERIVNCSLNVNSYCYQEVSSRTHVVIKMSDLTVLYKYDMFNGRISLFRSMSIKRGRYTSVGIYAIIPILFYNQVYSWIYYNNALNLSFYYCLGESTTVL